MVYPHIPLNSAGLVDMDAMEVIMQKDSLLQDHFNARRGGDEGVYGIRPGGDFLNEYEGKKYYLSYPWLYPYGVGCPVGLDKMTIKAYFRWAMRYHDGRFRLDKQFYFDLFGIQQKREVMQRTMLTVRRKDWPRISAGMANVTDNELKEAIAQERAGATVTNQAIADFIRLTTVARATVVGSDASRSRFRADIWGTTVVLGNAFIFLTINMVDHHDPIAAFLVGDDINLDDFDNLLGRSDTDRAARIIADPFNASLYFNVVVQAILEHLLGVTVKGGRVQAIQGVLGVISAYFGVVEAQGRGNLHLHLLIWLQDQPNAEEIKSVLRDPGFRTRLQEYIGRTIHAHADGVTLAGCQAPVPSPNPSYNRPINPSLPDYEAHVATCERLHVENCQYHDCNHGGCQQTDRFGRTRCKRRAPWETSRTVEVEENGTYRVRRLIGNINAYNREIHAICTRANGDIKLITNGPDTKDLGWYLTGYAGKAQGRTHNSSALLAKTKEFADMGATADYIGDIKLKIRRLLTKFANAMNGRQEISSSMAIASMEGWAPVYTSHLYTKIYLSDVHRILLKFILEGKHPNETRCA